MLSDIQIQILTKFLKSGDLRYSEARPVDTENDLYNYHLQFLVEKKLLTKKAGKYFLSNKGKRFVQRMDVKGTVKEYFKFSVLCYVVRQIKNKREILLQKHLRHPYFGDVLTISGKVHPGEKLEKAAKRKLKEETGLETEFEFLGVIRKIRRDKKRKLIEDTLYHICYGENPTGSLIEKNEFGENFWVDFDRAFQLQKKNITASEKSEHILRRIRDKELDLFYFNEELVLKKF